EVCRSRSTQTSNAVGCSERGAAAVTVSFRKRSSDRSRGFEKLPRGTKIAVEATGSWWWFVEKARELGHEVSLSHPKQTKAIAHARLKSDKVDAVSILWQISVSDRFSDCAEDSKSSALVIRYSLAGS